MQKHLAQGHPESCPSRFPCDKARNTLACQVGFDATDLQALSRAFDSFEGDKQCSPPSCVCHYWRLESSTRNGKVSKANSSGESVSSMADNVRSVRERIARAAEVCGRSATEITLLAITKSFPVLIISEAAGAGLRQFGENRVQEAESKTRFFAEK